MTGPSKPEYGPRPIEQQTWRRHHTGRAHPRFNFPPSPTSGCQRRRRKAIERQTAWEDGTYGVVVLTIGAAS